MEEGRKKGKGGSRERKKGEKGRIERDRRVTLGNKKRRLLREGRVRSQNTICVYDSNTGLKPFKEIKTIR